MCRGAGSCSTHWDRSVVKHLIRAEQDRLCCKCRESRPGMLNLWLLGLACGFNLLDGTGEFKPGEDYCGSFLWLVLCKRRLNVVSALPCPKSPELWHAVISGFGPRAKPKVAAFLWSTAEKAECGCGSVTAWSLWCWNSSSRACAADPSGRWGWRCQTVPRIRARLLSTRLLLHRNMQNNWGWFQWPLWELLCWQPQMLDAEY